MGACGCTLDQNFASCESQTPGRVTTSRLDSAFVPSPDSPDSTEVERLEIIETGRRRRWSDDEKLRIVMESLQTPRAISSTARRHGISRSLLVTWRRSFRPEPTGPEAQQAGFVPVMVVAAAETAPTMDAALARGRMVIVVGKDRRVIVDTSVDAAALARVLQVLERR